MSAPNARRALAPAAILAAIAVGPLAPPTATPAAAQAGACREAVAASTHVVLSCGGGLEITVERSARYRVVDENGDGVPEGVRLSSGAVYVAAPAGRSDFQILTPVAIAAIRGTRYAVDAAGGGGTAVFVETGAVNVVARGSGAGLVLRTGEGTDVEAGADVLVARRWGRMRIDALLARLGR